MIKRTAHRGGTGGIERGMGQGFVSFGLGSLFMYYLDPQRGARRRARVRELIVHTRHRIESLLYKASLDINNRVHGIAATGKHIIVPERMIQDEILAARIRSKMGRYVSHPHAIEITANQGRVIVKGPVLRHEERPFLHAIHSIPGVHEVRNLLEIHQSEENFPSLQGGVPRTGEKLDIFQSQWSPSTRVVTGTIGGVLLSVGVKRRHTTSGWVAGMSGTALCLRSITNQQFGRLFGIQRAKSSVRIQKIINIQAPLDRVYKFLANPIQFPKYLKGVVNEVRAVTESHFHWLLSGPFGIPIPSETIISLKIPNKTISWKSLPHSPIDHFGSLHFRSMDEGATRIETDIFYYPPMGMIGHALARLFHADPKSKLDEAFAEIKTVLEQGPSTRQLRRLSA